MINWRNSLATRRPTRHGSFGGGLGAASHPSREGSSGPSGSREANRKSGADLRVSQHHASTGCHWQPWQHPHTPFGWPSCLSSERTHPGCSPRWPTEAEVACTQHQLRCRRKKWQSWAGGLAYV